MLLVTIIKLLQVPPIQISFIENSLSWNACIDQLIPKLCTACCAIGAIKPLISQDPLILSRSYELWKNILGKFLT
jgi:hypothetical protein